MANTTHFNVSVGVGSVMIDPSQWAKVGQSQVPPIALDRPAIGTLSRDKASPPFGDDRPRPEGSQRVQALTSNCGLFYLEPVGLQDGFRGRLLTPLVHPGGWRKLFLTPANKLQW